MKLHKAVFFMAAILFVFPLSAFGQSRSITEKVYDSAIEAASSNTEKKIRTETTLEKRYEDGTLTTTVNLTQEYLPPGKERWVFVETSGNTVERTEIIYIGNFEYRKIDNGDWVKSDSKSGEGRIEITMSGEDKSVDQYAVEEIKEGSQTYRVYTVSTVNPLTESETIYSEHKVWIKDGLIYKTTDDSSLNRRDNVDSTSVTTYDYSPKPFKIAAPITRRKRKS